MAPMQRGDDDDDNDDNSNNNQSRKIFDRCDGPFVRWTPVLCLCAETPTTCTKYRVDRGDGPGSGRQVLSL